MSIVMLGVAGWAYSFWAGGQRAGPRAGVVYADGERLWIVNPDTVAGDRAARREVLNVRGKGSVTDPTWSPDGTQIAYAFTPVPAAGATYGSDIYVVAPDGTNPRAVFTHDVDGGLARTPVWSPDGAALYFSYSFSVKKPGQTTFETTQQIERLAIATGKRTVVVTGGDLPTLSPDGTQLAFLRVAPEPAEPATLWLASTGGGEARQLVPGGKFQAIWAPRFSPDGRQILFTASGGDRMQPRLTVPPRRTKSEGWPPAVAAHGFPMDLWLLEVATGRLELLAALGADDLAAAWSANGQRLAYLSGEGLTVLDLTTGAATPLTNELGFGALDWSR